MSHIDNGFRSLSLKRFPETDDVNPLLAWEAADEYLLQQLDDTEISGPVLILCAGATFAVQHWRFLSQRACHTREPAS